MIVGGIGDGVAEGRVVIVDERDWPAEVNLRSPLIMKVEMPAMIRMIVAQSKITSLERPLRIGIVCVSVFLCTFDNGNRFYQ